MISPTKVDAQVLRHQLRTEVRSMGCFSWVINYGLRAEAYLVCMCAGVQKAKALVMNSFRFVIVSFCPYRWLQPVVDDKFS